MTKRLSAAACAVSCASAVLAPLGAVAALSLSVALLGAAPAPSATAFLDTWAKIPSYTTDIKVHETLGSAVQDRTYRYAYLKPHFAKIDVTGGAGRGSGAVWKGGDTVSGHQGGLLSGVHLQVSIHDGRAVSLRGDTIDSSSFQNMADAIRNAATQTVTEETVNGVAADAIAIPYADANGATRRVIFLSKTTHLPIRRETYAGDTRVKAEDFSAVNAPANLTESDF